MGKREKEYGEKRKGMKDRMGDDFVGEECVEGGVDGCCKRASESYKVIEGCRRCVILLFVYITIMQSSEQHVLEYFFGRTVR